MKQCVLPLLLKDSYHISDFIVSNSNSYAYKFIVNWYKQWGQDPYPRSAMIVGSKSSGKTYLSKIWANYTHAYVIQPTDAIQTTIIDREKAFIIENVESWQEKKLLHYFNLINTHKYKKYLLLSSNTQNFNYKILDLKSRINSVFKVRILTPDEELIKKLIFKCFSTNSIFISEKAIDFLLYNLPRDLNVILECLQTLHIFSLKNQKKLGLQTIKNFFNTSIN